jgi:hypothetical protein
MHFNSQSFLAHKLIKINSKTFRHRDSCVLKLQQPRGFFLHYSLTASHINLHLSHSPCRTGFLLLMNIWNKHLPRGFYTGHFSCHEQTSAYDTVALSVCFWRNVLQYHNLLFLPEQPPKENIPYMNEELFIFILFFSTFSDTICQITWFFSFNRYIFFLSFLDIFSFILLYNCSLICF